MDIIASLGAKLKQKEQFFKENEWLVQAEKQIKALVIGVYELWWKWKRTAETDSWQNLSKCLDAAWTVLITVKTVEGLVCETGVSEPPTMKACMLGKV